MAAPAPLVSIIVPCFVRDFTQARLLEETLASVAQQTCQNFELILVDDGSPVDPAPIANRFPWVQCLRQKNAGSAVARNTGIGQARGAYFVFLDADDLLLPRALEAGLAVLAERPECGFAIGRREEMHYDGTPVAWSVQALPRTSSLYRILLEFDWYIIPPSSVVFRREVVEKIEGFRDPWGSDDLDFYLRAARQFSGWCSEEPAVTRYRRYSASSSRDGERMLRSVRAVYRREWPFVQSDPDLVRAYHVGLGKLTEIFRDCLAENLRDHRRRGAWRRAGRAAWRLAWESPRRLLEELRSWRSSSHPASPAEAKAAS